MLGSKRKAAIRLPTHEQSCAGWTLDPDTCRAASAGFSPEGEILKATPKWTKARPFAPPANPAVRTYGDFEQPAESPFKK